MSYEYKGLLKSAVRVFLSDTLQQDSETGEYLNLGEVEENYSDISIELDLVYSQASKADEYEPKAKAFDEVMDLYVNGSNKYLQTKRHTLDVFIEDVAEILKPFTDKYESGESND